MIIDKVKEEGLIRSIGGIAHDAPKDMRLVCAKCSAPWTSLGSPATCPTCRKQSFAIVR